MELKFNAAFLKELYENDVGDEDLEEILKCAAEVSGLFGAGSRGVQCGGGGALVGEDGGEGVI